MNPVSAGHEPDPISTLPMTMPARASRSSESRVNRVRIDGSASPTMTATPIRVVVVIGKGPAASALQRMRVMTTPKTTSAAPRT